jgi:hypothetical protein
LTDASAIFHAPPLKRLAPAPQPSPLKPTAPKAHGPTIGPKGRLCGR